MADDYDVNIGADESPPPSAAAGNSPSSPSAHEDAAFNYNVTDENSGSGKHYNLNSFHVGKLSGSGIYRPTPAMVQKDDEYKKRKERKERKKLAKDQKSRESEWKVGDEGHIGCKDLGEILKYLGENPSESDKSIVSNHKKSVGSSAAKTKAKLVGSVFRSKEGGADAVATQSTEQQVVTNGFRTGKLFSRSSSDDINNDSELVHRDGVKPAESTPLKGGTGFKLLTTVNVTDRNGLVQNTSDRSCEPGKYIPSTNDYHTTSTGSPDRLRYSEETAFQEVNRKRRTKDQRSTFSHAGSDRTNRHAFVSGISATVALSKPDEGRALTMTKSAKGASNTAKPTPPDPDKNGPAVTPDHNIDLSSNSFPALLPYNFKRRTSAGDVKSSAANDTEWASVTDDDRDSVKSQPLASKQSWASIAAAQRKQQVASSNTGSSTKSTDSSSLSHRSLSPASTEVLLESADLKLSANNAVQSYIEQQSIFPGATSISAKASHDMSSPLLSQYVTTTPRCLSPVPNTKPTAEVPLTPVTNTSKGRSRDQPASTVTLPSVEFGTVTSSDNKAIDQQVQSILSKNINKRPVPGLATSNITVPRVAQLKNHDNPVAELSKSSSNTPPNKFSHVSAVEFLDKPRLQMCDSNIHLTFGFVDLADVMTSSYPPRTEPAPSAVNVKARDRMCVSDQPSQQQRNDATAITQPETPSKRQTRNAIDYNNWTGAFDVLSAVKMLKADWEEVHGLFQKQSKGKQNGVRVVYIKSTASNKN